ncbi:MAG: nucleotide exchange factor GrpE [Bacteroidota bacterium]
MSKNTKADTIQEDEVQKQQAEAATEANVEERSAEGENQEESEESTDNQSDMDFASLDDAMKVIADLQQQLKDSQIALSEQKDQVLRLNADFVNFRNRQKKELSDNIRFANQDLLKNLLPVLDDFDRTLKAIDKTDNLSAVKEGISMVSNSMRKRFAKVGLEPIESMGKEFDSELHEAITTIPVEEDTQKGKVVDEVEKGYKLKDRVIRFSKVVVGE